MSETRLQHAIIHACQIPTIYPEIEAKVAKWLSPDRPFELGIELTRLVNTGKLKFRQSTAYATEWPAYSAKPFHRGFRLPRRARSPAE